MKTGIAQLIDSDRVWQRHMEMAQFGALPGGGVNRQALSKEEVGARAQLVAWGQAIGLTPYTDAAANLFLRLQGVNDSLPPLLIGSHIDSQPTGGKFDGVTGVLVALEVLEAFVASDTRPARPIELVAWMNEEGSRFAPGMMGSALYTGARQLADVLAVRDTSGVTVAEAISELRSADDVSIMERALQRPIHSYIECHIEQGPILEASGFQIGIVTGMQGKQTFQVEITGGESHAGTTPRSARRDALASAVSILSALQKAFADQEDITRFTVGRLNVLPNAPSVVPSSVVFSIDLRHPDAEILRDLGDQVQELCTEHGSPCIIKVKKLVYDLPLAFPERIHLLLDDAAASAGASSMRIASGAGHDARYLHYFCPSGMIFIPCKAGISHSELESAERADIVLAAKVLAIAAERSST